MAGIELSQTEADELIQMEKHRENDFQYKFPTLGGKIAVPLESSDKREKFLLDIHRGTINLKKVMYQNRARSSIVLIRLDLYGSAHPNPSGEEISCPHVHIYREGFADKWAFPIDTNQFQDIRDIRITLYDFMKYCNITKQPYIDIDLFI